jgi:hypothetical protein
MSKRSAAQALLDEPTASGSAASTSTGHREMQGAGGDGKKHSLDSDDEEDYEVTKILALLFSEFVK